MSAWDAIDRKLDEAEQLLMRPSDAVRDAHRGPEDQFSRMVIASGGEVPRWDQGAF